MVMQRRLEQTAGTAGLPAKVGTLLRRQFGLTEHQIRSAKFRKDGICRNGIQCRVTDMVFPGDRISVLLEAENEYSDATVPAPLENGENGVLDLFRSWILYEDDDLLVLNKPAGIAMHPSHGHFDDTLGNLAAAYFAESGRRTTIRPVGRLDLETSGVCIFAKHTAAAGWLSAKAFGSVKKPVRKSYLALASGHFENYEKGGCFRIDKPLRKMPGQLNRMQAEETERTLSDAMEPLEETEACPSEEIPSGQSRYQNAVTICTFLRETDCGTWLEVHIETGRTHQIRVHLASMGHPLIGDRIYGAAQPCIGRTALHCRKIQLFHPVRKEWMEITAPLPEDLRGLDPPDDP